MIEMKLTDEQIKALLEKKAAADWKYPTTEEVLAEGRLHPPKPMTQAETDEYIAWWIETYDGGEIRMVESTIAFLKKLLAEKAERESAAQREE